MDVLRMLGSRVTNGPAAAERKKVKPKRATPYHSLNL